jgi:hypothetical protein
MGIESVKNKYTLREEKKKKTSLQDSLEGRRTMLVQEELGRPFLQGFREDVHLAASAGCLKPSRYSDRRAFTLSPEPFLEGRVEHPDGKKAHPLHAVIPDARVFQGKSQVDAVPVSSGHVSLGKVDRAGNRYRILEVQQKSNSLLVIDPPSSRGEGKDTTLWHFPQIFLLPESAAIGPRGRKRRKKPLSRGQNERRGLRIKNEDVRNISGGL